MHIYKELLLWQKSMKLVTSVYKITTEFPTEERYGLTSQIKRCAVSIPSNIAEGAGRNSNKDFVRFLSISHGSSFELETQLILAYKLELINKADTNSLLEQLTEIQKMNYALQNKLK